MIHWNVSPVAVSLGSFQIRWYGLFFAAAFLIGGQIFDRFNARRKPVTDSNQLFKYVVIGTVVGARLGHCLFYDPVHYLTHPLDILKIWEGGLASHGGGMGVVLAVWLYCRRFPSDRFLAVLDILTIPTALAAFFIRMGNLMNSEILGRPTDVPWAFVFERVDSIPRHPAQLYEGLANLVVFGCIYYWYPRRPENAPLGRVFGFLLVGIFSSRFLLEFLKEHQVAFESQLPLDMGQLLSIPMVLVGLWLLFRKGSASLSSYPTASRKGKEAR